MVQIRLKNEGRLRLAVEKAISKKMSRLFVQGPELMKAQAEVLRTVFANSQEFQDLKGRLVGEFGFTPEEVSQLDRILELLVPGAHGITVSNVKTGPGQFLMQLEWVDFKALKRHDFAQHVLSKLDSSGAVDSITDIISWVEWLEEGATIRGFEFFRPDSKNRRFSRSGEGLMKQTDGGVWSFQPTRVFERIAKEEKGRFLKKGFGLLIKRAKTIFGV